MTGTSSKGSKPETTVKAARPERSPYQNIGELQRLKKVYKDLDLDVRLLQSHGAESAASRRR
jgi:hypothetical protein